MQELDEKVQNQNAEVSSLKEKVREQARLGEKMRIQKAELEKEVKVRKEREGDGEEGRLAALYEW